jgi:alanine racemase
MRRTWLEINLDAVAHNLGVIRSLVGENVEIMAVVKANAYGHGAMEVGRVAVQNGAGYLAVAIVDEALELREGGIKSPILVLGVYGDDPLQECVRQGIIFAVSDLKTVNRLSRIGIKENRKIKVHINVDTGMARLGIPLGQAIDFIQKVKEVRNVFIEGIFTNFTSADEEDKEPTWRQYQKFSHILSQLKEEGINIPLMHCANSAAILDMPSLKMNLVRPGISLYGLSPFSSVFFNKSFMPVAEFKTKVVYLQKLGAGSEVGYGRTYITTRPSLIATLPVGYADGYSRLLSNRGKVLVRGTRVPLVGRICMDHCMIDVTEVPGVQIGDEVVIWGKQGQEFISVEEIAKLMGAITYEIVLMVDKARVPKVFFHNG